MTSLEFIKGHAIIYENLVPKNLCEQVVYELNNKTFLDIYSHLINIIPKYCEGEQYVGPGKVELIKILPHNDAQIKTNKIIYDHSEYDDLGNCSLCTIYVYCNDYKYYHEGKTKFYANRKKNVFLIYPNSVSYNVSAHGGNVVLFTHTIPTEEIPISTHVKYILKIKLFYTSSQEIKQQKEQKEQKEQIKDKKTVKFNI